MNGSTCLRNSPKLEPPAQISIPCTFVTSPSGVGIFCYCLCAIGTVLCVAVLAKTWISREERVIRRSQPIFIYCFISGAILLNLTIIVFIGPNTDALCMMRPWFVNVASTIMFAPLVMKLNRVDLLFNNPKMKKVKVTDTMVVIQVCMILAVDIVILILWSSIQTPKMITTSVRYSSVYQPISDYTCSTGISQPFEIIMVIWKVLLLAFGVSKAISCWKIPSDISEAKHFAIAIYNIAMVGGICYFISLLVAATRY